ncbi:TonB-dependent receptor [Teredinibacter haidensis]|uniref:TonB-dependent receptor n=1 Tax=Teredinibacter haidensis TaxID=2731755 RepID=UPI0009488C77|nr:TonB-dependent receptor [Teredinibacter haidensis]
MKILPAFQRNKLALTISSIVLGGIVNISSVNTLAQEDGLNDQHLEEELIVTGFRKSIMDSIETKRSATTVVEAISAEDIGKLPDSSIAESIARLPGLAAQRLDGRASSVSVRGLGENFSATTLNGREQVSIGDNRGIEFDLYPSEIMSGVTVYKSPHAGLLTQGIAGTIDLETVKPLDRSERIIQLNGALEQNNLGELNPDGQEQGYRGTFSYIDQMMDDTVGIALAIAKMESPNQEERWNAWGYPQNDDDNYVLGGAKPFVRSSVLDRSTIMGVIEYKPSEKLKVTGDALYIDFADEKILRGIEIPGYWSQGGDNEVIETLSLENNFVTEGILHGTQVQVRNDFEKREAEMSAFGLNVAYSFTDDLDIEGDISHSDIQRDIFSLESYAGTGRGINVGEEDEIHFEMLGDRGVMFSPILDYSDDSLIELGGALNWGNGETVPADAQDGFINMPTVEDELDAVRISITKTFDDGFISALQGGINYSERTKTKADSGVYLTLDNYPDTLPIPERYRLSDTSLNFIGMGKMVSYDSYQLWKDGYYTETPEDLTVISRATNDWNVSEEITVSYLKADFLFETGLFPIRGNIGLQYVQTDQSSDGKAAAINDEGRVDIQDSHGGATYSDILPSLNIIAPITEQQTVRFAAAKTMSRSRMDRMNTSYSFSFDQTLNIPGGEPFGADGGNPELKPNMANQYDLSYEYYFSDDGYISVAAFYKELDSWQYKEIVPYDFAEILPPDVSDQVESTLGNINVWVNADGGRISGYEFTAVLPANLLSEALDGLGAIMSATFIDSSLETADGEDQKVPGLSEEIYNMTLYYENRGFQLRTSMRKRDEFNGERFANSFVREEAEVLGSELWDAQISYDFSESGIDSIDGLTVSLQAMNLTNEPYVTVNPDTGFIRDYQVFGTTYLLGASYRF